MTHDQISDGIEGAAIGTILSTTFAGVWPEAVHGAAVVVTAAVSAVAVYFVQRWLRKKFPG